MENLSYRFATSADIPPLAALRLAFLDETPNPPEPDDAEMRLRLMPNC